MKQRIIPVLKDAQIQDELNANGFVLIDLLNSEQLNDLRSLFDTLHQDRNDIYYDRLFTGHHCPDREYRKRMSTELSKRISPLLRQVFLDVQHTAYTFQIKGIGPNSALGIHQDWSFSREDHGFRTYTFWIPLIDSTSDNGTISLIPGSHITNDCIRGARIITQLTGHEHEMADKLHPIHIKAGQLLLFDSALIHSSSANFSNAIRVSVMTNIIAKNTEYFLYFPKEEESSIIEEYKVPHDFFLLYDNYKEQYEQPPHFGVKTRELSQHLRPETSTLSPSDPNTPHSENRLLGRLKRWFNETF